MKKQIFILITFILIMSSCDNNEPALDGNSKTVATTLKVSNSNISIGKSAGTAYISVTSNTDWTVYVNNSGSSVTGLDVSPLSGKNDGTVKVKYDAITTTYYSAESATIVFYYYSNGIRQYKTVNISRKGNTI